MSSPDQDPTTRPDAGHHPSPGEPTPYEGTLPPCVNPDRHCKCVDGKLSGLFRAQPEIEQVLSGIMRRAYVTGPRQIAQQIELELATDPAQVELLRAAANFTRHGCSQVTELLVREFEARTQLDLRPGGQPVNRTFETLLPGDIIEAQTKLGTTEDGAVLAVTNQRLHVTRVTPSHVTLEDSIFGRINPIERITFEAGCGGAPVYRHDLASLVAWTRALDWTGSGQAMADAAINNVLLDPLEQLINSRDPLGPHSTEAIQFLSDSVRTGAEGASPATRSRLSVLLMRLALKYEEVDATPIAESSKLFADADPRHRQLFTQLINREVFRYITGDRFEVETAKVQIFDRIFPQEALAQRISAAANTPAFVQLVHAIVLEHDAMTSTLLVSDLKSARAHPESIRELEVLNFSMLSAILEVSRRAPAELMGRRDFQSFQAELTQDLARLRHDMKKEVPAPETESSSVPPMSEAEIDGVALLQGIPPIETLSDFVAYEMLVLGSRYGSAIQARRQERRFGFTAAPGGGAEFLGAHGHANQQESPFRELGEEVQALTDAGKISIFDSGNTAFKFFDALNAAVYQRTREAKWLLH